MATAETVEQFVPVREGEYGDRVIAVEPGGIEYIPAKERHGRPLDLFWTWMSPNIEFATVFVGALGVFLFGGSFWAVALGVVVGNALGALAHGILSSWGPRYGVPMMVKSRGAFGYFGNLLPAGLNAFTANVGWFIVNSVSGAFALMVLFGSILHWFSLPFWLAFLVIVAAQVTVAFFGHNLVHVFERVAFPYLLVTFGLATVIVLSQAHLGQGFNAKAPLSFGGDLGAFLVTSAVAFGYAAGWNPYAMDYTRYQRTDVAARMVGFWAGAGVFLSCVVLEIMGAALVTVAGTKWGPNDIPTAQFSSVLPVWLAGLCLAGIALGAVCANVLNIYSGAMSFLTVGIKLPLHLRRAVVAAAAGIISYAAGVYFQADVGPGGKYENFLLLIAYWIGPWLGVVLTDHWLRRGRYGDEEVFYDSRYNPWKGVASMVVALLVSIWIFGDQSIYVGPFPKAFPQFGDLTFYAGFVIAAGIYYALHMGRITVDQKGEEQALPAATTLAGKGGA